MLNPNRPRIRYAVDKVVFDQNSFLSFVHDHIESAVREYYFADAAVEKEWHTRLAA